MYNGVGYNKSLRMAIRAIPTSEGCAVTLSRDRNNAKVVFYLTQKYNDNLRILRKIEKAHTEAEVHTLLASIEAFIKEPGEDFIPL